MQRSGAWNHSGVDGLVACTETWGADLGLADGLEEAAVDEGDGEALHVLRLQETDILPRVEPVNQWSIDLDKYRSTTGYPG